MLLYTTDYIRWWILIDCNFNKPNNLFILIIFDMLFVFDEPFLHVDENEQNSIFHMFIFMFVGYSGRTKYFTGVA